MISPTVSGTYCPVFLQNSFTREGISPIATKSGASGSIKHLNGSAARARKTSALRVFFKYLTNKAHLLSVDPSAELDSPKLKKTLICFYYNRLILINKPYLLTLFISKLTFLPQRSKKQKRVLRCVAFERTLPLDLLTGENGRSV